MGAANEGDLKKESGAPERESLSCSRGNGIGTRIYGRLVVSHIRQRMAAYGTLPDSLWNLLHVNVLSQGKALGRFPKNRMEKQPSLEAGRLSVHSGTPRPR